MSGAKNDDMVQAFAPNRTDDAFCVRVLPRRTITGKNFLNAESLSPKKKLLSVNGIAITEWILRLFIYAAGLDQLLCSPGGGGMVGYIGMQYPATVVAEYDENKKDFEAGCWNRKEIE